MSDSQSAQDGKQAEADSRQAETERLRTERDRWRAEVVRLRRELAERECLPRRAASPGVRFGCLTGAIVLGLLLLLALRH